MGTRRVGRLLGIGIAIAVLACPPIAAQAATSPSPSSQAVRADLLASGKVLPNVHRTPGRRAPSAAPTAGTLPYPPLKMQYQGGPIVARPHVFLDFWGPQWSNPSDPNWKDAALFTGQEAKDYITKFFALVGGSPWLNVTTQYCSGIPKNGTSCPSGSATITNPPGQLSGVWNDTRPIDLPNVPLCGQDCVIAYEAALSMNHFRGPNGQVDHTAIYFVFTGHGAPVDVFKPPQNDCGNHAYVPTRAFDLIYAYVPYQPDGPNCYTNWVNGQDTTPFGNGWFDGFSITGGHEYTEAITDPQAPTPPFNNLSRGAWYDSLGGDTKGEIGDKCAETTYTINGQDYKPMYPHPYGNIRLGTSTYFAVESQWSNADLGCTLGYPQRTVLPALANGQSFALKSMTTGLAIQNVGNGSASVSVQYFDSLGNPTGHGQSNASLPANASWTVRQDDIEPGTPGAPVYQSLAAASTGTAIVYASQPLRVVANEFASSGDGGAYGGPLVASGIGSTLYVPEVKNGVFADGRYDTEIVVMPIGPSSDAGFTNVSVTYKDQGGTAPTDPMAASESATVKDQGQAVFHNRSQTTFLGSATIVSTASSNGATGRPLAAVVNIVGPNHQVSSYVAVASAPGNSYGPSIDLFAPEVLNPKAPMCSRTLAAGLTHTMALGTDGATLWLWGTNFYGELGDEATPFANDNPNPVPYPVGRVVDFGGGGYWTMTVGADGTMRGSGYNGVGQLGNGTTTGNGFNPTPTLVLGINDAIAVAAGWNHALALHANGTVSAWGQGTEGELGDGRGANSSAPVSVPGLNNIVQLAAGQSHSLALAADGTVFSWGANNLGQLGAGTKKSRMTHVNLYGLAGVTSNETHGNFSMALTTNGQVWAWGDNQQGELGNGSTTNALAPAPVLSGGAPLAGITAIATGPMTALALKADGTVLAWGDNSGGQLGTPTNLTPNPVPAPVPGISGITELAAGSVDAFGLDSAGHVWQWGSYRYGVTTPTTPVQVPDTFGQGVLTVAQPTCAAGRFAPHSVLSVQNTTATATAIGVVFYDSAGHPSSKTFNLSPSGQLTLDFSNPTNGPVPSSDPYSLELVSAQPVVAVLEQVGGPQPSVSTAYNLTTGATAAVKIPFLENAGADRLTTSLTITITARTDPLQAVFPVTVTYYDRATGAVLKTVTNTLALHGNVTLYQTIDLPAGTVATARVSTVGGQLAAVVDEQGTGQLMSYTAQ